MTFDRTIDRIDHVERAPGRTTVRHVPGSDVKRKEFGGQSPLLHAFNAGAIWERRLAAEIVVVIRHRRRNVVMRIDDDCLALNVECSFPKLFIARRLRRGGKGDDGDKKGQDSRNTNFHLSNLNQEFRFVRSEKFIARIALNEVSSAWSSGSV